MPTPKCGGYATTSRQRSRPPGACTFYQIRGPADGGGGISRKFPPRCPFLPQPKGQNSVPPESGNLRLSTFLLCLHIHPQNLRQRTRHWKYNWQSTKQGRTPVAASVSTTSGAPDILPRGKTCGGDNFVTEMLPES